MTPQNSRVRENKIFAILPAVSAVGIAAITCRAKLPELPNDLTKREHLRGM